MCEEDATVGDIFTVSYSDEDQPPYTDSVFSIVGWTPDENIPGTVLTCVFCGVHEGVVWCTCVCVVYMRVLCGVHVYVWCT